MEISRKVVLGFTFVFGPLVLVSYAYGLSHVEDPNSLWGGVPLSWQTYIVPFMLLAAVGFLIYWWVALFQLDAKVVDSFRWPWGESDGNGANRLLIAYALFLGTSLGLDERYKPNCKRYLAEMMERPAFKFSREKQND